jgi:hypothetical protein
VRAVQQVALTESQQRQVEAWARELGSVPLAESLFALSHVHDGTRWVPLDLFRTAEQHILESDHARTT